MIREVNNKYLTRIIWIVMGCCMRYEGTGCVSNVNTEFESFLRGVNG